MTTNTLKSIEFWHVRKTRADSISVLIASNSQLSRWARDSNLSILLLLVVEQSISTVSIFEYWRQNSCIQGHSMKNRWWDRYCRQSKTLLNIFCTESNEWNSFNKCESNWLRSLMLKSDNRNELNQRENCNRISALRALHQSGKITR